MQIFRVLILFLVVSVQATAFASAQIHFADCQQGTGNIFNATVLVPLESGPSLNGAPLSSGSEIAVFTMSQDDKELCAGVITWQERNSAITVWGDDELTEVLDGMPPGEELLFKIWDRQTGTEYGPNSIIVNFLTGNNQYSDDAIFVVENLTLWGTPDAPGGRLNTVQLFDNYPNPFRNRTTITYSLPETTPVTLTIYDVLGKEVATLEATSRLAGTYQVHWDASGLSSGIYVCRLEAGDVTLSKKLSLIQ